MQASLSLETAQAYLDLRLAEARLAVLHASLKSREVLLQFLVEATTLACRAAKLDPIDALRHE